MEKIYVVIDGDDVDIFLSDGGVTAIHHNGEMFLSTYYQTRMTAEDLASDNVWDNVGEGKAYTKEWGGKQSIDIEMIMDAAGWLGLEEADLDPANVVFVSHKYVENMLNKTPKAEQSKKNDIYQVEITVTGIAETKLGEGETLEDLKSRNADIYFHAHGEFGHQDKQDIGGNVSIKIIGKIN